MPGGASKGSDQLARATPTDPRARSLGVTPRSGTRNRCRDLAMLAPRLELSPKTPLLQKEFASATPAATRIGSFHAQIPATRKREARLADRSHRLFLKSSPTPRTLWRGRPVEARLADGVAPRAGGDASCQRGLWTPRHAARHAAHFSRRNPTLPKTRHGHRASAPRRHHLAASIGSLRRNDLGAGAAARAGGGTHAASADQP